MYYLTFDKENDLVLLHNNSKDGFDDCTSKNLNDGDIVYVLEVEYTTGDSFHSNVGPYYNIVGIYTDPHIAFTNKKRINKVNEYKYNSFLDEDEPVPEYLDDISIHLLTDDKKDQKVFMPWSGYFETLKNIKIYACMVENNLV